MSNLLLEIGTEEIPAGYITPALEALSSALLRKLTDARIDHGPAEIYATPRRLAVKVGNVAGKQKSLRTEVIGPPARVGLDEQGNPTTAALKFAEKVGLSVNSLTVKETPKGAYLSAETMQHGAATRTLLKDILKDVILSIPFPKKMRWADLDIEFARPIHTILALLGDKVIGFNLCNLKSNRYTHGHSFMSPAKIKVATSDDYVEVLRSAHVLVDLKERKAKLEQSIAEVARQLGGRILPDDELVEIVNNLVEFPVPVAGKFDEAFLEVPDEVLINAMREHQKYFAIVAEDNKLMPCFIAVNNTVAKDMAVVAKGHERVLRARLADAQFFYQGDLAISNDERVAMLKRVLFQAELGTLYEKIERVAKIGEYLSEAVDFGPATEAKDADLKKNVMRAAMLSKSDLVSQVVGEFPKLQGIMGRIYASVAGESPAVAAAVEEHYRPIYSGAPLPQTLAGAILAIAEKIDSICGCFSVGLIPTGAADPYALRRQGIGIIQIMLNKGFTLPLTDLIEESLKHFMPRNLKEIKGQVYAFLCNRMTNMLIDDGFSKDTVAAVLGASADCIPHIWQRADALEKLKAKPDFEPLAVAFKRVVNIIKKAGDAQVGDPDQKLFQHESEDALFAAYQLVKNRVENDLAKGLFDQALVKIATLRNPVDAFFEGVMVMTDDGQVRRNRLALLAHIAALFGKFADFSKLSA
ncbi:MAG: glycine--tRNA ligase subunit beta [Desulfobacterales bacterium]|nr:MAG: glycine--tRNA ligase subunit beta [Desulfobacterales bacterium]